MERKLSKQEFISISFLLFVLFFGSGNLIFPPMLGNQAGTSTFIALIGFAVTAVVFPMLGILAVSKTDGVKNLGNRVGPVFAVVYPAIIFLAIGPGIAIPRNGSLAFEMSVAPYLSEGSMILPARIIYTVLFFGLAYYLCLQPGKLVDRIGKVLTPILLGLILVFFIGAVLTIPTDVAAPTATYDSAFTTGFVEGYNTMDTLAALNFGLVIAMTIKNYKIKDERKIIKYTSGSALVAGTILLAVYAMLAYVGMISSNGNQEVSNGGRILFNVTNSVFGSFGALVLILIFTLACLTTAVGLITSVSEYFAELTNNKVTYKQWMFIYTVLSLVLANFGLNTILQFSLPILVAIYPPAIVLIVMALLQDVFQFNRLAYQTTIYTTFLISIISGLRSAGIELPVASDLTEKLPFFSEGLEWILPAIMVLVIMAIFSKMKPAKN
jgi:LIVCS family branched-chain amino acid:cation transporter